MLGIPQFGTAETLVRQGTLWAGVSVRFQTMPLYEFRCRTCDEVFELRRPMSESNAPADCPAGHPETVRLLSMFASAGAAMPTTVPGSGGGGCCGGGCGCAR
jgi:putative FmdB family regulatory protein